MSFTAMTCFDPYLKMNRKHVGTPGAAGLWGFLSHGRSPCHHRVQYEKGLTWMIWGSPILGNLHLVKKIASFVDPSWFNRGLCNTTAFQWMFLWFITHTIH